MLAQPTTFVDKFNTKHRKEDKFFKQITVITIDNNELKTWLTARWYKTESSVYCCIWSEWGNVSSKTSGHGYNKIDATFEQCMAMLGFNEVYSIWFLDELAKELNGHVIKAHG